jgi:hypothetical protein
MKNNKMLAIMLVVCVAIAAPTLATHIEYTGATGGLWSNSNNWTFYTSGQPEVNPYTPDADGEKVEVVEGLVCTLDSITLALKNMEVYGGGVLNIVAGGVLIVDGELGIYGDAVAQPLDAGTAINLLGGTLKVHTNDGFLNGESWLLDANGNDMDHADTLIVIGTDGDYTTYTAGAPCSYNETEARQKGDTNYDCEVNLVDFAAMASNWMTDESLVYED